MPLSATQKWLQAAIISTSEPGAVAVAKHISPSPRQQPAARLAIYRDLYPTRLVHSLKQDYPLLYAHLGAPVFTQLALLYAQAHPSHSFTLNAFGKYLPAFVREVQGVRRPEFAEDLATFEHACTEAFHAAQAQPLSGDEIARVPTKSWPAVRLYFVPSARLLRLRYPVWRRAEATHPIHKRESFVVVYRRNYEVTWLPVSAAAFAVLESLSQGSTLGAALKGKRGPVRNWFQQWVAAGLFSAIRKR